MSDSHAPVVEFTQFGRKRSTGLLQRTISLAPGFSRVFGPVSSKELFQQLFEGRKPLKRLE